MEFRKYMVCDPFSGPIFSEHSLFLGGPWGRKQVFVRERLPASVYWIFLVPMLVYCFRLFDRFRLCIHALSLYPTLRCAALCCFLRCAALYCAVLCCVACSHYQLMRHNAEGTAHVNKK